MAPSSGTSSATDNGSGDSSNGCEPAHPCKPHCWTVRCVLIKALLLVFLARIEVLLNELILMYALFSIVPKCSENVVQNEAELQKRELDSLLPEVKGRILEHLDHEDIFKLKSLSKNWKALIESVEFIQALALKAKPVLTACIFFIDEGVWQWAAFDPKWNSTTEHKGKWRKLPLLTFLPPNCDLDPDLFKQFLFCANKGLVCMNFSKSTHEERLFVFNPLTQEWKELPPLLHRRNPVLMHMFVDHFSKSHHLLVAGSSAGEESLSRVTELFDSRTRQWERVGDFTGPAFALNEYWSGIFYHGNIFCIGFLELDDQTVKGILRYHVEGLWSMKWTDQSLPDSTIFELVKNNGDLFLFSKRDNDPLIEHWVDRIEWTRSERDSEEKTTFKLVNILKNEKSGGWGLEVYPQFALVPLSESELCPYNTVDHSGEVFDIEDQGKCEGLPALPEGFRVVIGIFSVIPEHSSPHRNSLDHSRSNSLGFTVLHDTIRARIGSAPNLERFLSSRSFKCSILNVAGFLTCLSVVGASPEPAPQPSSSQVSSTFQKLWYWVIGATIVVAVMAVSGLVFGIYWYCHGHEGGDSMRGVLRELTHPFGEGARGVSMSVRRVEVGEASVDGLNLTSSSRSTPV